MLTSARRTGSQNPIAIPGLRPHRQTGRSGLSVSGRSEGQIFKPPTEIGNRHDQQMSVIGLTNLPVQRPGPASATRSWRFDPTITVERNIADDKGRVIIAAGTRVNPLDTVPLRAPLVFLDGDDPAQLAWAARRFAATRAKLILVRGAPLELMKARQRRFYFDQGGSLVKHFGIRAVPATVEQQGRVLLITEQAIKPQKGKAS